MDDTMQLLMGIIAIPFCSIFVALCNSDLIYKLHKKLTLHYLKTHKNEFEKVYNQIGYYGSSAIKKNGREIKYSTEDVNEVAAFYGLEPIEWGSLQRKQETLQKSIEGLHVEEIKNIGGYGINLG